MVWIIIPEDAEQHRAIQEKLFKAAFRWVGSGKVIQEYTKHPITATSFGVIYSTIYHNIEKIPNRIPGKIFLETPTEIILQEFSYLKVREIAKDIIILGMALRQSQLKGYSAGSANELLEKYFKELKNDRCK